MHLYTEDIDVLEENERAFSGEAAETSSRSSDEDPDPHDRSTRHAEAFLSSLTRGALQADQIRENGKPAALAERSAIEYQAVNGLGENPGQYLQSVKQQSNF